MMLVFQHIKLQRVRVNARTLQLSRRDLSVIVVTSAENHSDTFLA